MAKASSPLASWLCLFGGAVDEQRAESHAQDGFSVIAGPDHPGFDRLPVISLASLEADAMVTAREARRLWENLGQAVTADGRSLRNALTVGPVSLWDVCATNIVLYYFQKICRNALCIDRLYKEQPRPERIVADDDEDLAARWLAAHARKDGTPFGILDTPARTGSPRRTVRGLMHAPLRRARSRVYSMSRPVRPSSGEAVFLGFVDRQLDSMLPVAMELRERENIPVRFFLPLSSVRRDEIRRAGFPCEVYESLAPPRGWRATLSRRRIDRMLSVLEGNPSCAPYLPELRVRLGELLWRALEYNAVAASLLHRLQPAVLVTSDVNHPLLRAACLRATQQGVPSINLPFGLFVPQAVEWSFIPQTVAAVMGPRAVEAIACWGPSSSRVIATGSPRHDDWTTNASPESRAALRASLGFPTDRHIISFLSVPADVNRLGSQDGAVRIAEKARMLRASREACAAIPNAFLVVVAHPEESIADLHRMLGTGDTDDVRVVRARSMRRQLDASDVAITSHSMAGVEAILLDIPLVTLNLSGRPDPGPYARDGGAIGVYEAQDLKAALEAALRAPRKSAGRRRFLDLHFSQPPQGSARLIARLTADLAFASAHPPTEYRAAHRRPS